MIPLAAALLMQAAAGDAGAVSPATFDLATVGRGAGFGTAEQAADEVARLIASDCPPGPDGGFVICGRRARTSYRVETSPVDRRQDRVATGELLVDHSGCGTRQDATGCFKGVPVVRTTFGAGGEITLLPTLTDRERVPDDGSDR